MATLTREFITEYLKKNNKFAKIDEINIYTDAFFQYAEAERNIRKNGSISLHPKKKTPMENPYLRVKMSAVNLMQKCKRVAIVEELWRMLENEDN